MTPRIAATPDGMPKLSLSHSSELEMYRSVTHGFTQTYNSNAHAHILYAGN